MTTFAIWLFFLVVFCTAAVVVFEMIELGVTTYLANRRELKETERV